ncbi:hypothetical protein MMC13_002631 [Lambiella insularis]|nr:hypothetical protein [Lambiella insularis]
MHAWIDDLTGRPYKPITPEALRLRSRSLGTAILPINPTAPEFRPKRELQSQLRIKERELREKNLEIHANEFVMRARREKVDNLLQEKEDLLHTTGNLLQEKEDLLQTTGNLMQEKGSLLQTNDNLVQKNDNLLQEKDNLIHGQGNLLQEKGDLVKYADDLFKSSDVLLQDTEKHTVLLYAMHGECTQTIGHLQFVSKDIFNVAKGLEEGGFGPAANVKKLRYRATDIDAVVDKHRALRARIENALPSLRED